MNTRLIKTHTIGGTVARAVVAVVVVGTGVACLLALLGAAVS